MKSFKLILLATMACVACGKTGTVQFTVCETTDVHGAYFDSLYNGKANETSFANVSSYLKQLRSEVKNVILIDNGDILQGDNAAYYYNYVKTDEDHVVGRIVNYLNYDVLVVGNHDIETGHEVYDRSFTELSIPLLASNAKYDGGEKDGKSYFKDYTIVERDGVRIAVIGMTNANIKSWLAEEKWKGIDFKQISSVAQAMVDFVVKKEKPAYVIVSVHSGYGEGQADVENEALYLAKTLKGIDMLLCGHDHRPVVENILREDGTTVTLMNAGSRNTNVAQCDVVLELKHGKVVAKDHSAQLVAMSQYPVDTEFTEYLRPHFEDVKSFANSEVGVLEKDLDFSGVLDGPTACVSLIHAVQLWATGADISITAPLSTHGMVPSGVITFQNLVQLYRFENTLNKIELTGEQIKNYLEFSYDNWVNGTGPSYNYDSAEGINYTVSRSAEYGSRVNIIGMSNGEAFDPAKTYTVAMNSYRSAGGGELLEKGAGIDPSKLFVLEKYKDIRSIVGDYFSVFGKVSPEAVNNWRFVK